MLSRSAGRAAESLLAMASQLRRAADEAAGGLGRIAGHVDDLEMAWAGPGPDDAERRCGDVVAELRSWPATLTSAAETLDRWAAVADDTARDERRARWRLHEAHSVTEPAERDVRVRSARSRIDEVEVAWVRRCGRLRDELDGALAALTRIADRRWSASSSSSRAVGLAVAADRLGMSLGAVDPPGELQDSVSDVIDGVAGSSIGPLVHLVLETARDRDLFRADGHVSRHDLAAVDEAWAAEAVSVWQRATGVDLGEDVASAVVDIIPTVAALMRADGERRWDDDGDGGFDAEPVFADLLADAAAAQFTVGPHLLEGRPDVADPIAAFVAAGAGDIDTLPGGPTASDWSYHFHGPPNLPESFDTLDVFRTLVFDWEQVWGDDASWSGAGFELLTTLPVARVGRLLAVADVADDAADFKRLIGGEFDAHDAAGGHAALKHVGRSDAYLRGRLEIEAIGAASTFDDLEIAERAMATALHAHRKEFDRWLKAGDDVLEVDVIFPEPIGRVVYRSGVDVVPATRLRLVILRADDMPSGFRLLTAKLNS